MKRSLAERFWVKVDRLGPCACPGLSRCWLWRGAKIPAGYGQIGNGRGDRVLAHRASWELQHGTPPPPDMEVCHRCDVKACVNPDHLFIGTKSDNRRDAVSKGLVRFLRGEASPVRKLGTADVVEIKRLRASGVSAPEIGRRFGVGSSHIYRIAKGQSWRHV